MGLAGSLLLDSWQSAECGNVICVTAKERIMKTAGSRRFLWTIIAFGILLRLAQYLFNRSLYLDEASISLNIIHRSFLGLLQPLDYDQGAPIGFLMVQKLLVVSFGGSEYVLRLFPLVCGVVSVFLFYRMAKDYVDPKAVMFTLGLFAISNRLIYYSSEVKQYSTDVVVVLLLYVMTIHLQSRKLRISRI